MKSHYGRVVPRVLDHRAWVFVAAGLLTLTAGLSLPRMGRAFLPEFNEGALAISAVTLPGTSLEASDRLGTTLEQLLAEVPEVVSTARRTGRAERDEHVQGVESAEIDVKLRESERSREEVLEEIRTRLSLLPGVNVTIGQPISHRIDHMLSGARANIAVKIFGEDLAVLREMPSTVVDTHPVWSKNSCGVDAYLQSKTRFLHKSLQGESYELGLTITQDFRKSGGTGHAYGLSTLFDVTEM